MHRERIVAFKRQQWLCDTRQNVMLYVHYISGLPLKLRRTWLFKSASTEIYWRNPGEHKSDNLQPAST